MSLKQEDPETVGHHDGARRGAALASAGGVVAIGGGEVLLLQRRDAHAGRPSVPGAWGGLDDWRAASVRARCSAGMACSGSSRQAERQQGRDPADHAQDRQPPDVPDQGETRDYGEEGGDEAVWAVLGHVDRLVARRSLIARRLVREDRIDVAMARAAGRAPCASCPSRRPRRGRGAGWRSCRRAGARRWTIRAVRPSQGSPVRSRRCSRVRMLTTS